MNTKSFNVLNDTFPRVWYTRPYQKELAKYSDEILTEGVINSEWSSVQNILEDSGNIYANRIRTQSGRNLS
jgi:hypothetical protein